jgi:ubiquinone/menaquinone biosynthesis C-methylase UbiE
MHTPISLAQLLTGLRASGELTRLRLLLLLGRSEFNVKDLTQILGQSQPRVSRHLKLLADAGLVERYHEGSWVYFRLAAGGPEAQVVRTLLGSLDADDPAIVRDWSRAEAIRQERFEAAQSYFRANAARWDTLRTLHVAEAEVEAAMREALGDGPFKLLADVGTGTGRVLEMFSSVAGRGIGVDINKDMLALARARLDKPHLSHIQVRLGDLFDLPLADGAADAVVLHQVLHYLDEPYKAIAEAVRVLQPGGKLLIADFLPHDLEFLREEHAHRRLGFERAQMAEWLARAGLDAALHREMAPSGTQAGGRLTVAVWLGRKREHLTQSGQAA